MKKDNRDFEKLFNSEDITLPESLSAEKIEMLLDEEGATITPLRKKESRIAKVAKWSTSIAASILLLIGLGFTADKTHDFIIAQKQDKIINSQTEQSDYSGIETIILNYYRDIYNSQNDSGFDFDDVFNGGIKFESADDMLADAEGAVSGTGGAANGSVSFGETNTQVAGVDEADIIKNDGKYIYYFKGNEIIITDCTDNKNIKIKSQITLYDNMTSFSSYGSEMYLYENYLAVVLRETSEYETYGKNTTDMTLANGDAVVFTDDCCCVAMKTDTVVRIYDVSDKSAPSEVYTHKITGDYVSSRITDGKLVTVSAFNIPYYQISATDFEDACYVLKSVCVPEYSVNGGELTKIAPERIEMFEEEKPTDYTVTSIIDFDNLDEDPKMNAFLGGGTDIYCTGDELFVAQSVVSWWSPEGENVVTDDNGNEFSTVTKIHKMNITDNGTDYVASVSVGGNCINQFSMDKNGDYFRIATNGWDHNGDNLKTMVYVVDKNMKIVGFLDNIAPGEQMKSARFMGDMLYLVTFMQTDPLFTVDLSDPTKPEIKGELKIPGFSSYLHPIGNGLVIGIGSGGTETGTDGTAKISLFDVSDPASPKELDNYTTSYTGYFTTNHKAFLVIDENTFAIPFYTYSMGDSVIVFNIENKGIIIDKNYECMSGGYDYERARGTFIDSVFYAVNTNGIIAYNITNGEKISEMKF